jgi:hypothetical protein
MANEYCPKCKTIRDLRETITTKKIKGKKGKAKTIIIHLFHCEECNSFIKSEETADAKLERFRSLRLPS